MAGTKIPYPSSDNFWSNSPKFLNSPLPISAKKEGEIFSECLYAIDESPEFYDPYSHLNLFLSQIIKKEVQRSKTPRKWSLKIEEELLAKITPIFNLKFPQCRLHATTLKKIWEKISYYSQQLQRQKEAIDQDGKLNVPYLIKESLKNLPEHLSPSYHAHQLASGISECIAIMDGVRPQLSSLTQTIWSMQRHLLTEKQLGHHQSPHDKYDSKDQLIAKTLLEISANNPQITHSELEHKVKEKLPSTSNEWDAKIHMWTLQGDMICRFIRVSAENNLMHLIQQKWKELRAPLPHHTFVSEVCQQHPSNDKLFKQVFILYKHAWYNHFGNPQESSFARFLKWHGHSLFLSETTLSREDLIAKLQEVVSKTLPLIPFDRKQAEAVLRLSR